VRRFTLAAGRPVALLTAPTEQALMLKLADYPDMLAARRADLAPHDVAFYLRDLAPPSTPGTRPSASWSTMRRWRARAWRCWPPRARCCATRWRCWA
jgi:hypothetical protein